MFNTELEKSDKSSYIGTYYEKHETFEPFNIHILKSGSVNPQMYIVVYEDALDGISIEKLTADQIGIKYGILLE